MENATRFCFPLRVNGFVGDEKTDRQSVIFCTSSFTVRESENQHDKPCVRLQFHQNLETANSRIVKEVNWWLALPIRQSEMKISYQSYETILAYRLQTRLWARKWVTEEEIAESVKAGTQE